MVAPIVFFLFELQTGKVVVLLLVSFVLDRTLFGRWC